MASAPLAVRMRGEFGEILMASLIFTIKAWLTTTVSGKRMTNVEP